MINNSNLRRRSPIAAGIMLVTAAASITGLLGATPPANAAPDAYVAVAVGLINDAPPVTTVGGISTAADQNQAYQGALSNCVSKGGHQCVVEAVMQNGCAAAASNDFGEMVGGTDITVRKAQENATGKLQNQQGARVVAAGCSNGDVLPPAPACSGAAKTGADGNLQSDPGRPGGPPHRPQRSGVAVHLCDGDDEPEFRARGQRHVRPQDRATHSEIPERERNHQVRQRNQHSDHHEILNAPAAACRHSPKRECRQTAVLEAHRSAVDRAMVSTGWLFLGLTDSGSGSRVVTGAGRVDGRCASDFSAGSDHCRGGGHRDRGGRNDL